MELDLLSDVDEKEAFKLCDGRILKNLYELLDALKTMGADIYSHHVTPDRNDFVNWVRNAIGDRVLADRLQRADRQDKAYRLVYQRVEELKQPKTETPSVESKQVKSVTTSRAVQIDSKELKSEFVDFLLGLVIGFIIGLIIKTLV